MKTIEDIIRGARKQLIELGQKNHPYIATNLSSLEIQAVLQEEIIEKGEGHVYLPAHHATSYLCLLAEKGQKIDLRKLGTNNLPYLFHTGYNIPGVEYNSGAMGASAPVAISSATINPKEKSYLLLGNAEMREGRTFESLSFAAAENINNLVVMINDNGKSLDGKTALNYTGILKGFGFKVKEVNGHDVKAVQASIKEAALSKTKYGVVFKTQRGYKTEFVDAPHQGISEVKSSKQKIIGKAISRIAQDESFTVLAADTAKSTGLKEITKVDPSRLVNVGCSEQLLIGGLEAYQLKGKPVIAGTFAKFILETGREQLEQLIGNYQEGQVNPPTVLIASHNGLSPGINGRSHHALNSYEFIEREDVNLYHASDEIQLEAMTREALSKAELTIILTERESDSFTYNKGKKVNMYQTIHDKDYQFKPGFPEEMTAFKSDGYTLIIANGLRTYDALKVAEDHEDVEVLSLSSFPLKKDKLIPYLQKAKKVIVVEESIKPYLGEKVELIARRGGIVTEYESIYVTKPIFGGYENLVRKNGLDAKSISSRL